MKNSKKAWLWGCLPGTVLIANFMLYALINFILRAVSSAPADSQSDISSSSILEVVAKIINIFQGFMGIVLMVLIPAGIVVAIIYATNAESDVVHKSTPPPEQPLK